MQAGYADSIDEQHRSPETREPLQPFHRFARPADSVGEPFSGRAIAPLLGGAADPSSNEI
jgi:hypothetical protein